MEYLGLLLSNEYAIVFLQITLAMLLGMALGVERSLAGKTAGMRTYALVSMGSCLYVIVSSIVVSSFEGVTNFDPLRVTASIVTGVGFIGAGIIVFKDSLLRGLTTAAGLWVTAAIGVAVGYELYAIAMFSTILTLFVFTALWFAESMIKSFSDNVAGDD